MNRELFRRAEAVFNEVVDLPLDERAVRLSASCAGDAALQAEVESLLECSYGDTSSIEEAIGHEAHVVVRPSSAALLERRIGPYRLVRELGQGGMGAVYLAQRDDDEYRTEVAIKVLHQGVETADAVARFRDERQILASLEHPGIVRLLDGGHTADGLPYLVMEHVAGGVPITAWAADHALGVRARVELFRQVCAAVAFAHQKLVVHRDLKPGNILVAADGTPKLLDFGIAKLIDPAADRSVRTRTGLHLLTPEYASPEQVRGEPASTATDVYALGAVLYELLTDAPAQRIEGDGLAALRAILEVVPPRPSTVAPAARRRALAGDLDNIVRKALEKEVDRRYPSVEQLSGDLQRYLEGLPVRARAATWSYRAQKFVRRHRGALALAALVAGSLATATVVSLRQAARADRAATLADEQAARADANAEKAERRFADVRRLASSLLFEVDGKIQSLAGATGAREVIVSRALEYLDVLAAEAGDDAALLAELAAAYTKIGDIQGNDMMPNLGRPADALASYRKALRILDGLAATTSGGPGTDWARVRALVSAGVVARNTNDMTGARASFARAAALLATLPDDASFDYLLAASTHVQFAATDMDEGRVLEANASADACAEVARRWLRATAAPEGRYWLGIAQAMRGYNALMAGDTDAGLTGLREGTATLAALAAQVPDNASYAREVWHARLLVATALAGRGDTLIWVPTPGDAVAAEREFARALATAEELARADPGDVRAALERGTTLGALAAVVAERDAKQSLPLFDEAAAAFAALPASSLENVNSRQVPRAVACAHAIALARDGQAERARAAARRGEELARLGADEGAAGFQLRLAPQMCRYEEALAEEALGDRARAVELHVGVARDLRPFVAKRPSSLLPFIGLLESSLALGRLEPEKRCAHLAEARRVWAALPGKPTAYTERRRAELEQAGAGCP